MSTQPAAIFNADTAPIDCVRYLDGGRILRGGKPPTKEDVLGWINRAPKGRKLAA